MSLRNRVTLAGGVVVLAVLILASVVVYTVLSAGLKDESRNKLKAAVTDSENMARKWKQANEQLFGDKANDPAEKTSARFPSGPAPVAGMLMQFIPGPVPPGTTSEFITTTERDRAVSEGREAGYFQTADYQGVRYRVYTAQVPQDPNGTLVRVGVPLSEVGDALDRLRVLLITVTIGSGLLAAVAARLAADRVLHPVHRLTRTVEHITATQDLTARIDAKGDDEIARLARAFATMTAAVDASVTTQRRLVADASHELRTPLTSLTTNLELLNEGPGTDDPQAPELVRAARAQTHELTVLVNDLIDLARYGREQTHTEDTRLDLVARRVADRAAARATGPEIRTGLEECLVHGDPDALERATANLVDNALKWSPPGGVVEIRVEARGTLRVSDEGPGIPPEDLPYVFDRFYRSPVARSLPGSGLGLAIVRQIAETHGGRVTAGPSAAGGAELCLTLPVVDPPAPADPAVPKR
ncbi:Signal transduction histidine-protein kinase/phosphatase MprB [Streptomyces sp. RB5]|uniref:histidine kinase n=1 Tax=Streptomyces smaragdinus TaxID=2585196 RepID=A0A7K0CPU5_9ACTN|nr:HAMP domain-containing sensor histidine kinase [Streptomyces smaragdinus]MQY15497.1 Signal transduction histidine-protein kinase/phosphatase MprB [Streptomyces smaragdinus]